MQIESPVNNFIDGMGGSPYKSFDAPPIFTNQNIEVIYSDKSFESKKTVSVNQPQIKSKRTRYELGKDVVFKCVKCNAYIGVGKKTEENIDVEKVKCFTCNSVYDAVGCIRDSNNPLWQVKKGQEVSFDQSVSKYLTQNKALVIEL